VLRIEDTDLERSDPKYEKDILESLKWLGIEYDEGPIADAQIQNSKFKIQNYVGEYGSYRQSERLESYQKYLEKLLADGNAFYCFHTEAELEVERERLLTEKKLSNHVCEYREAGLDKAVKLLKEKLEHIIRFKTPAGRVLKFNDMVRGEISFESDLLGDFSLAKDLTAPLYNFAVVIDDFEMKISHVIRGEDHISNTPKQMLIQEALGFAGPVYAHLPLILGPDRSKLSKRHGVTSINEYREQGYLPEVLVNFMAFLGWNSGTGQEVFTLSELVEVFDIAKVQKSGAVFNIEKLDWLNGYYIRQKPVKELAELCLPFLEKAGLLENQKSKIKNQNDKPKFKKDYIQRVIELEQPRLKKLSEIGERTDYFFRTPQYEKELLRWKNMDEEEILGSLQRAEKIISNFPFDKPSVPSGVGGQFPIFNKENIEALFLKEIGEGDKGITLWPLRVALTGKKASPGPFEIMDILGTEETLNRLNRAKEILRGSISS